MSYSPDNKINLCDQKFKESIDAEEYELVSSELKLMEFGNKYSQTKNYKEGKQLMQTLLVESKQNDNEIVNVDENLIRMKEISIEKHEMPLVGSTLLFKKNGNSYSFLGVTNQTVILNLNPKNQKLEQLINTSNKTNIVKNKIGKQKEKRIQSLFNYLNSSSKFAKKQSKRKKIKQNNQEKLQESIQEGLDNAVNLK